MAYNNSNSGLLFKNDYRADNPKAPTLKGTGRITINNVEYELDLAAWTRESQRAGKFLSLSIKLATPRDESRPSPSQPQEQEDEEDLPW